MYRVYTWWVTNQGGERWLAPDAARPRRRAVRRRARARANSRAMSNAELARAALRAARAAANPFTLHVSMSNKHVHAQIVRAVDGHVVASASTVERAVREREPPIRVTSDKAAARRVGEVIAERAKKVEVPEVRWARPYGARFHGKFASLLTALQSGGVGLA